MIIIKNIIKLLTGNKHKKEAKEEIDNSIYFDAKIISHDKSLPSGRSRHVYFGKPRGSKFRSFDLLPTDMKGVSFYFGGNEIEFIKAFFLAGCGEQLETLEIGSCSYRYDLNLDYTEIIAFLSTQDLSNIKHLKLGLWQLYSNSESFFGRLGDLTQLLNKATQLQTLHLSGHFTLKEKQLFSYLQALTIEIENYTIEIEENSITQATLNCLFDSQYPCCDHMWLDLRVENTEHKFTFSEKFLDAKALPLLEYLLIAGKFEKEEEQKFLTSKLAKKPTKKSISLNE